MSFTVFYPDSTITTSKGFGKVAHLPCIFDSRPGFHLPGSQYLIDRGLGVWHPKLYKTNYPARPPAAASIRNYANWLVNFLEWTEARSINVYTCSYHEHVYQRYQTELVYVYWSRDGKELSPSTINSYVDVACDFLSWMAYKGFRSAFHIPTKSVSIKGVRSNNYRGRKQVVVETRVGKVRQEIKQLQMPSDEEVRAWLSLVYTRMGSVRGMMCEMVLLTAMRRAEVSAFRVDTVPRDPRQWHITNPTASKGEKLVRIEIRHGTKGHDYGKDHGDKIGPKRSILVPLYFVERLHQYCENERLHQVNLWVKRVRGASLQRERLANSVHLFRDEASGKPPTDNHLYEAWTGVPLPFKGWSPHAGRHWWACSVLWREIKQYESWKKLDRDRNRPNITRLATDVIRLQIQPQLGHRSETSTLQYLKWAMDMLGTALPEQYMEYLDAESTTS